VTNKKLTILLCAIGVFTLLVIAALIYFKVADDPKLGFEIVKLLVQFFLVGILGVVISLLVQKYNRQRDKELLINDLRKTVLNSLIRAYSDTKKARRIFMANRLEEDKVFYKIYDEQLKFLIEIQLSLEILVHQIKISQVYFGQNAENNVIQKITTMEKYLAKIIDEYKDSLKNSTAIPEYISLNDYPTISLWVGKENEENNFLKDFVTFYREAVEEIRRQIWADL